MARKPKGGSEAWMEDVLTIKVRLTDGVVERTM
jgi:predicted RNA-binding protein